MLITKDDLDALCT